VVFVYFNRPHLATPAHGARDSLRAVLCQEARARALGSRGDPEAVLCQETRDGDMGHVAVPELSYARRREPGPRGTWRSQSCREPWWRELELRGTWRLRSCPMSGDGSRGTRGHVRPSCLSSLTWSLYAGVPDLHGTDSGPRSHLGRGYEHAGGANSLAPRSIILNFLLDS
jgi:hypothetical protein